ncbi:MAG: type II secretion system protein GspD [Robiginitomaculum sp.]|nr:MAG: type II secretion system protein GspD [Robiginitomaculum sp.]
MKPLRFSAHCKYVLTFMLGIAVLLLSPVALAQDHVINLKDADIRAFIEDTSVVTGKTFIVDPRVTGTVSVSSQAKLSKSEVFQVFLDVLRVRGFTATPTASGAYRITLIQGAAQDAPLSNSLGRGVLSTAILKLKHGDAALAAKLIKPVLHSQGRLTANPGGRVLVITDYPENIRKAREIVAALDVDQAVIITIPLQNISAREAKDAVQALMGSGTPKVRNNIVVGETVRAFAIDATNSLVLRGDSASVEQLRQTILQMDAIGNAPRGQVSVISLHYADGRDVLTVLEKILPAYFDKVKTEAVPTVAYDPGSNTLIISAKPDVQKALESVVRKLDVRRAQVLVEAIIVEISDTAAEDLGVQFLLAGNEGSGLPFISTNYSRSAPNLLAITGALAGDSIDSVAQGDLQNAAISSLLGLQGGTFGIGGYGSSGLFGAVLNAVSNDTNSNVLSTPFVTTLDNVPATFLVGQEIPVTSGEALGTNNSNPFRTITREEIGIKLEVLPQINEGDVIRLEIRQEVSSISADASVLVSGLVTNKREISTTVLANDGEVIVLGGLMQDDEQLFTSKVPFLGDIPVIGNLFKSHNNTRKRTNLMVFIRPTIIRSREDMMPLTQQKLDIMRRQERRKTGGTSSRLDGALQNMGVAIPPYDTQE